MNNLKQLGLAWHNYHDATKKLPGRSWPQLIRPYIELQNYAVGTPIKLYLCPSRSPSDKAQRDYGAGSQSNSIMSATKLQHVPDGLSNTMILAERCANMDGTIPTTTSGGPVLFQVSILPVEPLPIVTRDIWYNVDSGTPVINDTAYQDGTAPARVTPDLTTTAALPFEPVGTTTLGFGSRHPGGMNMLLGDGSVRSYPYGHRGLTNIIGRNDRQVIQWPD